MIPPNAVNGAPNKPPFSQVETAVEGHAFGVSCRPRQFDTAVDGLVRSWRNIYQAVIRFTKPLTLMTFAVAACAFTIRLLSSRNPGTINVIPESAASSNSM